MSVITVEESWFSEAQQSWSHQVKVMLILSLDVSGVVEQCTPEYIPKGQTINQHVCKEVLIRLGDKTRSKRL